jgi:hypothetical protein
MAGSATLVMVESTVERRVASIVPTTTRVRLAPNSTTECIAGSGV